MMAGDVGKRLLAEVVVETGDEVSISVSGCSCSGNG